MPVPPFTEQTKVSISAKYIKTNKTPTLTHWGNSEKSQSIFHTFAGLNPTFVTSCCFITAAKTILNSIDQEQQM